MAACRPANESNGPATSALDPISSYPGPCPGGEAIRHAPDRIASPKLLARKLLCQLSNLQPAKLCRILLGPERQGALGQLRKTPRVFGVKIGVVEHGLERGDFPVDASNLIRKTIQVSLTCK